MAEQGYNLKYTGAEIDALLDKANEMDELAQIPSGGSARQVLSKKTSANYDVEWIDQTGGSAPVIIKTQEVDSDTLKDAVTSTVLSATEIKNIIKNNTSPIYIEFKRTGSDITFYAAAQVFNSETASTLYGLYFGDYTPAYKRQSAYSVGIDLASDTNNVKITYIENFTACKIFQCQKNSDGTYSAIDFTIDDVYSAVAYLPNFPIVRLTDTGRPLFLSSFSFANSTYTFTSCSVPQTNGLATYSITLTANNLNSITRTYAYTIGGVKSGGTAGQVLAKKSSTNYDTEWIDVENAVSGVSTSVIVDSSAQLANSVSRSYTFDTLHNGDRVIVMLRRESGNYTTNEYTWYGASESKLLVCHPNDNTGATIYNKATLSSTSIILATADWWSGYEYTGSIASNLVTAYKVIVARYS